MLVQPSMQELISYLGRHLLFHWSIEEREREERCDKGSGERGKSRQGKGRTIARQRAAGARPGVAFVGGVEVLQGVGEGVGLLGDEGVGDADGLVDLVLILDGDCFSWVSSDGWRVVVSSEVFRCSLSLTQAKRVDGKGGSTDSRNRPAHPSPRGRTAARLGRLVRVSFT